MFIFSHCAVASFRILPAVFFFYLLFLSWIYFFFLPPFSIPSLFYPAALLVFIVNPCFAFPLSMEKENYHDDSIALHKHLKAWWKPGFMSQPCKHNGPQFLPRAFAFLFPREGFQRLEGNFPHTRGSLENLRLSTQRAGWVIWTEVVEKGMGITCSSAHLVQ